MNNHRKKIVCSLICSTLLLGTSSVGSAEENAATTEESFNLDEYVVTASRIPVKLSEAGANITVVTREEIEKGAFTSLSDVLRKNNVNMAENDFSAYPILNGDDRVLIMVDGRKMNYPHWMLGGNERVMNINSLPVKNIERIEIVRGAASALYGSDAAGGVINIITRKATASSTTVDSSFGSWGLRRYSIATEGKENGFSYLLTAEHKKRDSFKFDDSKTDATKTHPDSQVDEDFVTLRLDKDLGNGRELSLQFEHTENNSGFGAGILTATSLPGFPGGYQDVTGNNIALTYRWQQDTGANNFFRVYRNAEKGTFYNSFTKSDYITPYSYEVHATGADWQQSWKISDKHTLVGGAGWRKDYKDDKEFINESISTKSLFMENRWNLPQQWSLSLGTRYDDQSITGDKTTSNIVVNRGINKAANVYASWGQFVRNPILEYLYGNSRLFANTNLKAETGDTVTVGVNTKLDERTKLQASIYSSRVKDAYEWSPRTLYRYLVINGGDQKRRGLDINLVHTLSPQWDVSIGYVYSKIEEEATGTTGYSNYDKNSQPNGYNLGLQYTQDKWNADLNLRAATGRSLAYFTSNSYLTLDMGVNYQLNPETRIYLKGYNLTNKSYELIEKSTFGVDTVEFPMAGRNFYVGIEHRM
jgi:vitamin B12 transporter